MLRSNKSLTSINCNNGQHVLSIWLFRARQLASKLYLRSEICPIPRRKSSDPTARNANFWLSCLLDWQFFKFFTEKINRKNYLRFFIRLIGKKPATHFPPSQFLLLILYAILSKPLSNVVSASPKFFRRVSRSLLASMPLRTPHIIR